MAEYAEDRSVGSRDSYYQAAFEEQTRDAEQEELIVATDTFIRPEFQAAWRQRARIIRQHMEPKPGLRFCSDACADKCGDIRNAYQMTQAGELCSCCGKNRVHDIVAGAQSALAKARAGAPASPYREAVEAGRPVCPWGREHGGKTSCPSCVSPTEDEFLRNNRKRPDTEPPKPKVVRETHELPHGFELRSEWYRDGSKELKGPHVVFRWLSPNDFPGALPGESRVLRRWTEPVFKADGDSDGDAAQDLVRATVKAFTKALGG